MAARPPERRQPEPELCLEFADPELTLPPQGRNRHSACVVGNKMVVFGGYAGRRLADIQVLDLETMTWASHVDVGGESSVTGAGRWGHSAVAVGSRVFVFGGFVGVRTSDLLVLNTEVVETKRRRGRRRGGGRGGAGGGGRAGGRPASGRGTSARRRRRRSMVDEATMEVNKIRSVVEKGVDERGPEKTLVRLGALKDEGAVRVEWMTAVITHGVLPSKRHSHTAVVVDGKMYVFGGSVSMKERVADMHALDLETLAWSRVGPDADAAGAGGRGAVVVPDTRYAHGAVVIGTSIYVFGGSHYSFHGLNDMHVFDTVAGEWARVASVGIPPSRRYYTAMIAVGADIYVFGGYDGSPRVADVHIFHTLTSTWEAITPTGSPPSPRHGHTAVTCDAHPGVVFLYGGFDASLPWAHDLVAFDTTTHTFSRPLVATSLHRAFTTIVDDVAAEAEPDEPAAEPDAAAAPDAGAAAPPSADADAGAGLATVVPPSVAVSFAPADASDAAAAAASPGERTAAPAAPVRAAPTVTDATAAAPQPRPKPAPAAPAASAPAPLPAAATTPRATSSSSSPRAAGAAADAAAPAESTAIKPTMFGMDDTVQIAMRVQ